MGSESSTAGRVMDKWSKFKGLNPDTTVNQRKLQKDKKYTWYIMANYSSAAGRVNYQKSEGFNMDAGR